MVSPAFPKPDEVLTFINRDHIVSVTIQEDLIVITTTAGTPINIPASTVATAKFADELANSIDSNFVSITHRQAIQPLR